ncbi:endonuclease/exonuclease/phosphatase family protein, partial [candidate division KSB1 bacterium]
MRSFLCNIKYCFIGMLVFLLVVTDLYAQEDQRSAQTLRVMTYNIFHGETMNRDFNIQLIADVINAASPDIVALQEVDFKTGRVKGIDLVMELGKLTGMVPLFGKAMPYDGGEYGEGILSKYSFIRTKVHPLPFSPGHEPRCALEVVIDLPSGVEISFIGTHLDHTRDETDRLAQAEKLNELFSDYTTPAILAGDLNALPESAPMNILYKVWQDASVNFEQPTIPSSDPQRRIDYVLFHPAER